MGTSEILWGMFLTAGGRPVLAGRKTVIVDGYSSLPLVFLLHSV